MMERLTEKHYLGTDHYMKCSENCDVDMNCIDCPAFDTLVERLAAYEDTDLLPEEVAQMQETQFSGLYMAKLSVALDALIAYMKLGSLEHLRELAEADKDGRVVVLPCKSGEHVFALLDEKHVSECEVKHAALDDWYKIFFIAPVGDPGNAYSAPFGAFGRTVFLTREEAEKALEAKQDGTVL